MVQPERLLAAARRDARLTQAQLAGRLGISQAAIAQLEKPGANPRVGTLDRALRALGAQLVLEARPNRFGIDERLIRQQLELTPAERIQSLEAMYRVARELAEAGARARGELA